jgi:gas vesicle protein
MQRKNTRAGNRSGRTTSRSQQSSGGPGALAAALGIAGGIGIGAGLMFLFDPNQGERRRRELTARASDALEGTRETAHQAWGTVADRAAGAASSLSSAIPALGEKFLHRASDTADEAQEAASGLLERARSHLPRFSSLPRVERHSKYVVPATAAGAGLTALAIGAAAMWLFDPDRGRARRAWVMQKTERCINDTGRFFRATGRHLGNKSKGYYHEARSAAQGAMDSAAGAFSGESSEEETPATMPPY